MFNIKTFIIFVIYAAVLYFGKRIETQLAARNSSRPGLILPIVGWIAAMLLSIQNFYIAFDVQFRLFAFLAALCLFLFFSIPAIYFSLLYVEGRKLVRARQVARSQRMRQAKTQQRAQSNLNQRYQSKRIQKEPIVYSPDKSKKRPVPKQTAAQKLRSGRNAQGTNYKKRS